MDDKVYDVWLWVLTAMTGIIGFFMKTKFDEVDRQGILLNKTREEVARDHVTRAEYKADLEKLGDRIEAAVMRLEDKIDRTLETKGTRNG